VEVGLAGDDGSGGAQAGGDGGVFCDRAVGVAQEGCAAGGAEAGEVEAVLKRDGDAPEGLVGDLCGVEVAGFGA
jgi:hypothetical protein